MVGRQEKGRKRVLVGSTETVGGVRTGQGLQGRKQGRKAAGGIGITSLEARSERVICRKKSTARLGISANATSKQHVCRIRRLRDRLASPVHLRLAFRWMPAQFSSSSCVVSVSVGPAKQSHLPLPPASHLSIHPPAPLWFWIFYFLSLFTPQQEIRNCTFGHQLQNIQDYLHFD